MGYLPYQLVIAGFLKHQPYDTHTNTSHYFSSRRTTRISDGRRLFVAAAAHEHFLPVDVAKGSGKVSC